MQRKLNPADFSTGFRSVTQLNERTSTMHSNASTCEFKVGSKILNPADFSTGFRSVTQICTNTTHKEYHFNIHSYITLWRLHL